MIHQTRPWAKNDSGQIPTLPIPDLFRPSLSFFVLPFLLIFPFFFHTSAQCAAGSFWTSIDFSPQRGLRVFTFTICRVCVFFSFDWVVGLTYEQCTFAGLGHRIRSHIPLPFTRFHCKHHIASLAFMHPTGAYTAVENCDSELLDISSTQCFLIYLFG
jgi:hypothetical protein